MVVDDDGGWFGWVKPLWGPDVAPLVSSLEEIFLFAFFQLQFDQNIRRRLRLKHLQLLTIEQL